MTTKSIVRAASSRARAVRAVPRNYDRINDDVHFLAAATLSKEKMEVSSNSLVILTAMRHNLRELYRDLPWAVPDGIDLSRSNRNRVLVGPGSAAEVSALADAWIKSAGVKVRKNASMAVEIVFSLPRNMLIDFEQYFRCSTEWVESYFAAPVLSSVMHDDQQHPHAHVLLLPLKNGKLMGSALLGDRRATTAMQADFHEKVGKKFGMKPPKRKRKRSLQQRKLALDVAAGFVAAHSSLSSEALIALLAPHLSDPFSLLTKLGVPPLQQLNENSFRGMMTRPCKPEARRAH
ncbi:plasmid recombination protein [Pseudoduganella sp. R-34]|uniref:plasmid recombination protein n=1 Tax=Pseudoduganella sp. R-34 TaxID=3404062 RepID=UPI003CED1573